eukprot:NODE_590_length_5625_cov_0.852515.p7 type:complete len:103 gc:universal NODE_590_length_5625_cov_0.852515:4857-5165(+)
MLAMVLVPEGKISFLYLLEMQCLNGYPTVLYSNTPPLTQPFLSTVPKYSSVNKLFLSKFHFNLSLSLAQFQYGKVTVLSIFIISFSKLYRNSLCQYKKYILL